MVERRYDDGRRLRAETLEHGLIRVQAGGYDGYPSSLLERYGLVEPLPAAESESYAVEFGDTPSFRILRDDQPWLVPQDTSRVATAPTKARNQGCQLDLPLAEDELMIGGGDHQRQSLLLNGRRDNLWIRYPSKHIPVPFFMSNQGYGLFFNTTRRLVYDIGAGDPGRMRFAVPRDFLDVFIIPGDDYDAILDGYTRLTGRPGLPPRKSFGLWLIANTKADAHAILQVARNLREAQIPCDNLSLEPDWMQQRYDYSLQKSWSVERFMGTPPTSSFRGGPRHFTNALKRMGFDLGVWLCTRYDFTWEEERRIAADRPDESDTESLEGLEISHLDDNVAHGPVYMDTNTRRDEAWFEHLKPFVDDGVRFFKVDPAVLINEFPDRLYGNGCTDEEMHNIAFLLCSKQMCHDYEAYTKRRYYGISVAGWAGQQRFPGTWAGDTGGGEQPLVGILQDAVIGHPLATCDMSTSGPDGVHLGFLLPWALINSWAYYHYPGYQGDFMDGVYRDYSNLRMQLLPYYYSLAWRASQTGQSIVRPLCMLWPEARESYDLTRQFMVGDSLLATAYQDHVVLPPGRWYDLWNDQVVEGDWDRHELTPPANRGGHLLLREGALIPTIAPRQHVDEGPITEVCWWLFPGAGESSFTLYGDDGDSLAYRDGDWAAVTLQAVPDGGDRLQVQWSDVLGGAPRHVAGLTHRFRLFGVPQQPALQPIGTGQFATLLW